MPSNFVNTLQPPMPVLAQLPLGVNSYNEASYKNLQNMYNKQNELIKKGGKKSKKRKKGGSLRKRRFFITRKSFKVKKSKRKRTRKTKKSKRKGGAGAGAVEIYSPQVNYTEMAAGDNTLDAINKKLTQTLLQSQANAQFDKLAK
jgi:hypothetical protein